MAGSADEDNTFVKSCHQILCICTRSAVPESAEADLNASAFDTTTEEQSEADQSISASQAEEAGPSGDAAVEEDQVQAQYEAPEPEPVQAVEQEEPEALQESHPEALVEEPEVAYQQPEQESEAVESESQNIEAEVAAEAQESEAVEAESQNPEADTQNSEPEGFGQDVAAENVAQRVQPSAPLAQSEEFQDNEAIQDVKVLPNQNSIMIYFL